MKPRLMLQFLVKKGQTIRVYPLLLVPGTGFEPAQAFAH